MKARRSTFGPMIAREWVYTRIPLKTITREFKRLGRIIAAKDTGAEARLECREHRRDMAVGIVEQLLRPNSKMKGGAN